MKEIILALSVTLYFLSYIPYVKGIIKGNVKPRPLSWLGWSLLLGTGILSQIFENGLDSSMSIVIAASSGCFGIFIISLFKKAKMNEGNDYLCFALGIVCMIIYILSKDALITTLFALFADLFVGIPTISNVYKNPRSEDILAWGLGTIGIFLSFLVIIPETGFLIKLYPTYLLFFNLLIFGLCFRRFNYSKIYNL